MAKKHSTPNLDNWIRQFGHNAGDIASATLSTVAPGISETASSGVDFFRESRAFITKSKVKVQQQAKLLNTTALGRDAQSVIKNAFSDIKNGTFSLNRLSDDTYDSLDDFDLPDIDIPSDSDNSAAIAVNESRKSMAIIGKAVAEGNAATIQGMSQMTSTLSAIQVKSSNALATKLTNVTLLGINQTTTQLANIGNKLDVINKNIVSMIDFQRGNSAVVNQASLEFYSQSAAMMDSMGKALSGIQDFIENTKTMNKKKSSSDMDPFEYGFTFSNYKELVKKNFNNSMFGMLSIIPSMLGMMGSMGESPVGMFKGDLFAKAIPKKTRKSIERLDSMFTGSINELLYTIGDMRTSTDLFKNLIGSLFGKERPTMKNANLGNFKKDYMGWNGVAQRTLTEVIPSYLARIESAITKQDARYYNTTNGKFMTNREIERDYRTKYQNTMEFGMTTFRDSMDKAFKNGKVSDKDTKEIQNYINEIVNDQLSTKRSLSTKDARQGVYNKLKDYVSPNELRDIMMEYNSNIQNTLKSIQSFIGSMEDDESGAIYRNLFSQGKRNQTVNGDIFAGNKFSISGKLMSDLTEEERVREESSKKFDEAVKNKKKAFANKFRRGNTERVSIDQRMANQVDRVANAMFDTMNGLKPGEGRRRSRATTSSQSSNDREMSRALQSISNRNIDTVLRASESDLQQDAARINQVIEENLSDSNSEAGGIPSGETENSKGLKALVLSLHTNFLKPMVGGIFGKNGFFSKIFNNEKIKEWKKKLFDDDDSIFKPVGDYFKDAADYMKHVFTGKGYTKRTGDKGTVADSDDSVFSHLKNGYDFIFKNTMKYLFGGEDFAENKTYQKYFSWMDIKGRKDRKKQQATEGIDTSGSSNEASINKEDHGYFDTKTGKYVSAKTVNSQIEKSVKRHKKKLSKRQDIRSIQNTTTQSVSDVIMDSTAEAAESISSSAKRVSDKILGTEEGLRNAEEQANESIMSKIKKHLPKTLAFGTVGAVAGGSVAAHGAGVLGSLFLPGGPIGGAIAGIGISILSRSQKFQEFLFGKEDADGKKTGGLISQSTKDFFKKNLPTIVGGTALGAISGFFKGAVGMGNGGFLLSSFLPGGAIGGALLAFGVSILKSNEKFNNILFGEKSEDGKRSGGFFSGGMNAFKSTMEKTGGFFKGGLKGLGAGALTGLTLSKFGLFGQALSLGGPVGMGLAGLGIGIASQTKKFQDLLFGTEEFDEDGNLIGRYGNGLLTQLRNMLVINIFDPIRESLHDKMIDFAFWAKKNIMYPFREAFGPIIDSMKSIKKDISDVVHDAFNNMAESVGKALKTGIDKVFQPITSLMGTIGKVTANTLSTAVKVSLTPLTASLKVARFATRHMRKKALGQERRTLFEHAGDIYRGVKNDVWANDDRDYGTGILGSINRGLTHIRDLKQGVDAAGMAYEDGMQETGQNHLSWMGIRREKRIDRLNEKDIKNNRRAWKNIDKIRNEIRYKYGNGGFSEVRLSDDDLATYQKKLAKFGVDTEWIKDNKALNKLIYNKKDFQSQYDPNRSAKTIEDMARGDGIKIRESNEQLTALRDTKSYQEFVKEKFTTITQEFTKLGFQQGLQSKTNVSISDMTKLNDELKENGLTWDDIRVNPRDLLNHGSLSDAQYEKFLTATTGENAKSENEAIIDIMNDVKEATQTSAALDINEASIETGASNSTIAKATGRSTISSSVLGVAQSAKKIQSKIARDQREAAESEAAMAGTRELDESEEEPSEAIIEGATEKNKDTVFGSIGGFFSKLFGTVGGWLTSSSFWTKVGIGVIASGFIGPKLRAFISKAWNTISPFVTSALSTAKDFIAEKAPDLITAFTNNMISNMGVILSNAARIMASALTTAGKLAVNAITKKITGKEYFNVDGVTNTTEDKTFDSLDEAKSEAEITGKNVYVDPKTGDAKILSQNSVIDENGKVVKVSDSGFKSALGREAIQFIRSPLNRRLMTASAKGLGKAAGWATGIIPGAKIVKGTVKTAAGIGKGAYNAGKNIFKKGAKEAAETGVENIAKTAAKEATEAVVEDVAKSSGMKKSILNWLNKKALPAIKAGAKYVSSKISSTKFGKAVSSLVDLLVSKIKNLSDDRIIKRIFNKITAKSAEAAGKTASTVTIVIPIAFGIYDGINGLLKASYLFGVDDSDVTPGMRVTSSIMEILLGTAPGAWIDILLEVFNMITGYDGKREFAKFLYKATGGDAAALDEATKEMELETEKYNKANNTNITTKEYNELKNSNKSIWGRIKQGASWLASGGGQSEKYKNKYDFSQYKVSKSEVNAYKNQQASVSSSSQTEADVGLFNGPGPERSRSIGYGNTYLQNDQRWGSYSLGSFPDGTESTMATGGCGPTALSMVANKLGANSSPLNVAAFAKHRGYIKDGGATANLFTQGASALGMDANAIGKSGLTETLKKGKPVVLAGKSNSNASPYTNSGHVIMANGLDANGNAIVNDPMRGETSVPVSKLARGMTHGWSYSKSNKHAVGYGPYAGITSNIANVQQRSTMNGDLLAGSSTMFVSTDSAKTIITNGFAQNVNGVLNWNDPSYYSGRTVGDLKIFANTDFTLLVNSEIPLFKAVYDYYVTPGSYPNETSLSINVINNIADSLGMDEFLGGHANENGYNVKNGFPFFNTNDERWSSIKWRDDTVNRRGSDLSSLAMIASAFGSNVLNPGYIYNNWLQEYPQWWDVSNGINANTVYKDGGFNAMKSTQVDGRRLKVSSKITNTSSIMSKLKSRIPVVLTGYRYNGSIFGGAVDKADVDVNDKDAISTIVGLYANDSLLAVNDPYTTIDDNSVFNSNLLYDKVANNTDAIISAYAVTDPDGKGLQGKVDMSRDDGGSTFQSTEGLKGLDKLSAIFNNIIGVANNMISSLIDGTSYKSIMNDGEIEEDVADDTGVGEAIIDDTPITTSSGPAYNQGIASTASTKIPMATAPTFEEPKVANGSAITATPQPTTAKPSPTHTSSSGATHGGSGASFGSSRTTTTTSKPQKFTLPSISDLQNNRNNTSNTNSTKKISLIPSLAPSVGGGSRDLPIGYGLNDVISNIGAIAYASQAQLMGQDYESAKQAYLTNSISSGGDTTASSAGGVDVNLSGGGNVNFASTEDGTGESKNVPSGYGKIHTYMGWQCITSPSSQQYKLRSEVENYNADGMGLVGDRYAVAMKPYYGSVGDYLNIQQEDGTTYKVAIADIKANENASQGEISKYVHGDGSVIEFVVDKNRWYSRAKGGQADAMHANVGTASFMPELGKNIVSIKNVGNYWKTDAKNSSVGNGFGSRRKSRAIGYGYSWLQVVQAVKQAIATKQLGYSQSRYISLSVLGQTIDSVRTDCSGFVSACLKLYGSVTSNLSSYDFTTRREITGFSKVNWSGWDRLVPGDIIARNGHVEIFAKNENNSHYVFSCGSNSSCNNPGMTPSSKDSYTTVWRPNEAGVISNETFSMGVNTGTMNTGMSGVNASLSPFDSLFDSMKNGLNSALSNIGFGRGPRSSAEKYFADTLDGEITSGYGKRDSSFGNEYHRGIDVASRNGTPIKSPIDGILVSSGNDVAGYGNYAVVKDGEGNNHIFAHMNKPVGFGVGTRISKNSVIGEVGSSGRSTGDHLHYEIRRNGNKYSSINPSEYKYDRDISKNLNVNSHNASTNAIGGGEKDLDSKLSDKLTVALKTDNVETKLDSLIEVMKSWAERDAEKQKQIQNINQINNTTVAYGSGKDKKVVKTKTTSSKELSSENLAKIHKSIASKVS